MDTHAGPALIGHSFRWLFMLALVSLCLLLALVVTLQALGLRAQGVDWHDGLVLQQWQWQNNSCVKAHGERLRITGLWPVTMDMKRVSLPACEKDAEPLTPPPWTPHFDVTINQLIIPGLPSLRVEAHQRKQRWNVKARHQNSKVTALYDRHSGRWTLHGQAQASDMTPDYLGVLTFAGKGMWLTNRVYGAIRMQGEELGYRGQPQRTDATLTGSLTAQHWQMSITLATPVAIANGWSLEAHRTLQASGHLGGVESLQLNLQATGPQGTAQLVVDTVGAGTRRGAGALTLTGPELKGHIPLLWGPQGLELSPASIRLPEGIRLSWSHPVILPLARAGNSIISAELAYQDARIKTVDSLLSWQGTTWSWQGQLDLSGKVSGHALTGALPVEIDASGVAFAPASLTLEGAAIALTLRLPATRLQPPRWAAQATFEGRYRDQPVSGTLGAAYEQDHWAGRIEGIAKPPFYTQGGRLDLVAPWYGKDGQWFLGSGTRVTVAQGLIGTVLAKPVSLTASTPLRLDAGGISGTLQVKTNGIVASRWRMPAVKGRIKATGQQGHASLTIPEWQSALTLTAALTNHQQKAGASGSVALTSPLSPAMTRGLGFNLQAGTLTGGGHWQWRDHWQLQGDLTVSGLVLDWGGIKAAGGNGTAHFELRPEAVTLNSTGPILVTELNVGMRVSNIRATVQSDLTTWNIADATADVLGGYVHAPALQWPSPTYQEVQIRNIDLAEIAALQNDPNPTVQLAGRVGGTLPLQLLQRSLALQAGTIRNEGSLLLKVLPSGGVSAMGESNRAVELALDTLSHLAIHDLRAQLEMTPDGWLDAAITIKGKNPRKEGLPVVLNYTHRENVFELLRSLRIADEISRQVVERAPTQDTRIVTAEDLP